jgi:broad specificity phosphatase PhoE
LTLLALLRHGDTAWTAEGRIQGRSDVPLSEAGRKMLCGHRLPEMCRTMTFVTSPLMRCVETATCLGLGDVRREPRLAEMSWGAWEGRRLADLREELGEAMRANEERGWDFRPEGGETPREVYARVASWLREVEVPTLAVTHRGVIRGILATATGWDMRGKSPAKLDWHAVHVFRLGADGTPSVERLNAR